MHMSRPIDAQGRFIGVAVTQSSVWRFIATHPAAAALDGTTFSSLDEARRVARQHARSHHAWPASSAPGSAAATEAAS